MMKEYTRSKISMKMCNFKCRNAAEETVAHETPGLSTTIGSYCVEHGHAIEIALKGDPHASYKMGMAASMYGLLATSNPFNSNTAEYKDWLDGFNWKQAPGKVVVQMWKVGE